MEDCPPDRDPTVYGWETDHEGALTPQIAPEGTVYPPPYILKLIPCQCKFSECSIASCNCANIGCTMVLFV